MSGTINRLRESVPFNGFKIPVGSRDPSCGIHARMDTLTHGSFIWLEALCAERNIARRYTVALSRDLYGASIVEFAWGRIGTKGQGRAVSFASEDEASRFARQLLRRRASAPKRIGVPYREVSLLP